MCACKQKRELILSVLNKISPEDTRILAIRENARIHQEVRLQKKRYFHQPFITPVLNQLVVNIFTADVDRNCQ